MDNSKQRIRYKKIRAIKLRQKRDVLKVKQEMKKMGVGLIDAIKVDLEAMPRQQDREKVAYVLEKYACKYNCVIREWEMAFHMKQRHRAFTIILKENVANEEWLQELRRTERLLKLI